MSTNYNFDGLYLFDDASGNPNYPITYNTNYNANVNFTEDTQLDVYLYVNINDDQTSDRNLNINVQDLPANNTITISGKDGSVHVPASNREAAFDSSGTNIIQGSTDFSISGTNNGWFKISFSGVEAKNYTLIFSSNNPSDTFSCFLPTTRILLADNTYKRISQIKKGDTIRGLSGNTRRVLHAGYVNFKPERTHPESLPRCIPMNFFGKNLPRENLYLSGGHSIVLLESNEKFKQEIEETERETGRTVNMSGYRKLMSKKLSNLRVLKSTDEIKQLTGSEPRYYHLVIDDISDGMIADGLPVEATSEDNFIAQGFIENF